MTNEQRQALMRVAVKLQSAREDLDDVMYFSGQELPEAEFLKVSSAYDNICKAIDKIS